MKRVSSGIRTRPESHVLPPAAALCAIFFLLSAIIALWPSWGQAASVATVDQADGYSGKMLDKILQRWSPPTLNGKYRVNLQISLDGHGNVVECKVLKASGASSLDISACKAFKDAAPFGAPPYGVPVETYFSFWTGENSVQGDSGGRASAKEEAAAGAAPANNAKFRKYLSAVTRQIRNVIYIPVETKAGTYNVTARIKCDKNGKILSWSILKGSGDSRLDKYVLQGIKRAETISPPPEGLGDTLDLTFTLTRM